MVLVSAAGVVGALLKLNPVDGGAGAGAGAGADVEEAPNEKAGFVASAGLGASAGLAVEPNENGALVSAGFGAPKKELGAEPDEVDAAGVDPKGFLGGSEPAGLDVPN